MPSDAPTAFFSYSREDSDFALRLAEDLKAAGAQVWLDQLDIAPGQRWARAVQDALNNSPRMLVILSPSSVSSTNVEDEVTFALEEHKTIIPVCYRDCKVPFQLRPFQYVDFRTDYARGLKVLLKTLDVAQHAAAEGVRLEEARKQAAEQTRLEQERKRAEAKQARLEDERRRAAEQARLEEERKQAAEDVRVEQGPRQATELESGSGFFSRSAAGVKGVAAVFSDSPYLAKGVVAVSAILIVALILYRTLQSPSNKQQEETRNKQYEETRQAIDQYNEEAKRIIDSMSPANPNAPSDAGQWLEYVRSYANDSDASRFRRDVQGKMSPVLTGTVFKVNMSGRDTQIALSISNPPYAELILNLDGFRFFTMGKGEQLEFKGIPTAVSRDPVRITFDVKWSDLHPLSERPSSK